MIRNQKRTRWQFEEAQVMSWIQNARGRIHHPMHVGA